MSAAGDASTALKVLILGGYGTFGGRLARLLAAEPGSTLLIAGRSLDKAARFCATLPQGAAALVFDRDGNVEQQLRAIGPDMVVDATGPFQSYGSAPYRVVQAALALGIDYIDLADGSGFVAGIRIFDDAARARGVFILSGASTFPALTVAAVRQLVPGLARIDSVVSGIAPSPHAGVGANVMRAIAGYAGRPVLLRRDARAVHGYALTESMRYTIAPPGILPLRNLRFSLVDVPDLRLLPDLWPSLRSVWMGAGPVPELLHRALNVLAWMVRLKLIGSLSPLAGLFHRVVNKQRWGEHRGGMFVAVSGAAPDGARVDRSWHLLAEGDDGALIPAMAAAAIVRRCLARRRPAAGARAAAIDLELADYAALFRDRRIAIGCREEESAGNAPLYRRILGPAWDSLPEQLKAMHEIKGGMTASGAAMVERGMGLLARLAAALFRFPPAGRDVPVTVTFAPRAGGEIWTRNFAGRAFTSVQRAGRGSLERLIVERFGPFAFAFAVVLDGGRLRLVVRHWRCLGLPLPMSVGPRGEACEFAENGRFRFHVEIGLRWTGPIVRYRGWLVPSE